MWGLVRKLYAVLLNKKVKTSPVIIYIFSIMYVGCSFCEPAVLHLFTAQYIKRTWMNLKAGIMQLVADSKILTRLEV